MKLPSLEWTIKEACTYHEGQVDKMGEPYILHPIRVMLAMVTPVERHVAILHDVMEDTGMNEADLRQHWPSVVADAVMAMSKTKGQKYEEYLEQVGDNPIALKVKMADIRDNMSPIRIFNLKPGTQNYLCTKYKKGLHYLRHRELEYES